MIPHYKCSSVDNPGTTVFICNQKGCEASAFMCGSESCQCKSLHHRHQGQTFVGLLKEVEVPTDLPEKYAKMEAEVDLFIDSAIKHFQNLRVIHKDHLKRHMERCLRNQVLLKKLRNREPVSNEEATGNRFFVMTQ